MSPSVTPPMVLNPRVFNDLTKNPRVSKPSGGDMSPRKLPGWLWRQWREFAGRADLRDANQVAQLWRWAVDAGIVANADARRREFFIQAVHAVATATRGPAGFLFATNIARGEWFANEAEQNVGIELLNTFTAKGADTAPRPASVSEDRNLESALTETADQQRTKFREAIAQIRQNFKNKATGVEVIAK